MRLPQRRLTLALSMTDLALLGVMAALATVHLRSAFGGSLISWLFVGQHIAIFVVTLLHRPAGERAAPRADLTLAWAGTLLPLTLRATAAPAPGWGLALLIIGSVLATVAILSLGRSFGMEPAHRGLQTRGLYRIVRHPIYAAYLLIIGGFLLAYPACWNGGVALIWLLVQVVRIRREEVLLSRDDQYLRYAQRVRWRVLPGVW